MNSMSITSSLIASIFIVHVQINLWICSCVRENIGTKNEYGILEPKTINVK